MGERNIGVKINLINNGKLVIFLFHLYFISFFCVSWRQMVWSNNEIRNGYRVRGIWQACHIALCVIKLGRVQVLYKGNWGMARNAYNAYVVRGRWGSTGKMLNVKDLNSCQSENGTYICEISRLWSKHIYM